MIKEGADFKEDAMMLTLLVEEEQTPERKSLSFYKLIEEAQHVN